MLSCRLLKSFLYLYDRRNWWIQEIKIKLAKEQKETNSDHTLALWKQTFFLYRWEHQTVPCRLFTLKNWLRGGFLAGKINSSPQHFLQYWALPHSLTSGAWYAIHCKIQSIAGEYRVKYKGISTHCTTSWFWTVSPCICWNKRQKYVAVKRHLMGDMINWIKFVYEQKQQQTASQRYRYSKAFLASWGKKYQAPNIYYSSLETCCIEQFQLIRTYVKFPILYLDTGTLLNLDLRTSKIF